MILGIDPAIASMGYAIFDPSFPQPRDQVIDHGIITTSSKDAVGSRLASIRGDIIELVKLYRPDQVAIEKPFFFSKNTNAHLVQFALGVIVLALHESGVGKITWVATSQAKKAVGTGVNSTGKLDAKKGDVGEAVRTMFGLEKRGRDDAFDAIAIAYAASIGMTIKETA